MHLFQSLLLAMAAATMAVQGLALPAAGAVYDTTIESPAFLSDLEARQVCSSGSGSSCCFSFAGIFGYNRRQGLGVENIQATIEQRTIRSYNGDFGEGVQVQVNAAQLAESHQLEIRFTTPANGPDVQFVLARYAVGDQNGTGEAFDTITLPVGRGVNGGLLCVYLRQLEGEYILTRTQ